MLLEMNGDPGICIKIEAKLTGESDLQPRLRTRGLRDRSGETGRNDMLMCVACLKPMTLGQGLGVSLTSGLSRNCWIPGSPAGFGNLHLGRPNSRAHWHGSPPLAWKLISAPVLISRLPVTASDGAS